jgi:hypothetical protein
MNMSVLGISGPPPDIPPAISERDKTDRKIVVVLICLVIVVVVGFAGTAAFLWIHYSAKYTNIDKSHETLSWNLDPPLLPSTTYTNPPYGVTLKLPGKWVRVRPPYRCFITLSGSPDSGATHFDAMFWPIFTGVPSSVDTQAAFISAAYSKGAGWTLEKSETMQIDGRDARVLSFATQQHNLSLALVVLNKGSVTYALVFAGPGNAPDGWQQIHDALPNAITVQ